MPPVKSRGGRAGSGAAILLIASSLVACSTAVATAPAMSVLPTVGATAPPSRTALPSSPTGFVLHRIDRTFAAVTSLTSTGDRLYWASEGSIWRFMPGEVDAERVYENPSRGALVWDVAAAGDAFAFSEQLTKPAGTWRLVYVPGDGLTPIEVDRGAAAGGRPPTLDIDENRLAWAGFDEPSGEPRSFLRFALRADLTSRTTLLDADIDERLLWYPELDGDSLWFSTIDPDFEGTGTGDDFHIETMDLSNPSAGPARFDGSGLDFEPSVTTDWVAWKTVDPGFSALTWGELHVLDRRSNARLVIPGRADHPSVGSRFVAFEEFFHRQLLLYDLATRSIVEIPNPMAGARGTIGVPSVAVNLLGYGISVKGAKRVLWTLLPD